MMGEDGALERGLLFQGMKDEHGALQLGCILFVQGMKSEDGAPELG